jgi:MFS family permease
MLHDSSNTVISIDTPLPLRRARWVASTAFFLDGLTFATWVTRIPTVQDQLGLRNSTLGFALLMMSVGALLSMPITGQVVARFGSRAALVFAIVLFGSGLLLPGLAVGALSLSAALLIFGTGFGALNIAANAQAVSVEREYGRPIMASFHAMFSLGGIAGAGIGSLASMYTLSPQIHFMIMGALVVATGALLWRWLLDDRRPRVAAREGRQAKSWRLALLGAIAFCAMLGEGAMADWSAVYLRQVSQTDASVAALGFAAFSLAMTLGRLSADRLTLAIGAVRMVQIGGAVSAAGLLLAMIFPQTWTAIAGFGCVGAGLAALVPTTFSAAGRTPGVAPSVAIATVSTTGYFGFLLGPPLIGFASEQVSLRWAMLLVFAGCCIAATLARHMKDRPQRTEEGSAMTDAVGAMA